MQYPICGVADITSPLSLSSVVSARSESHLVVSSHRFNRYRSLKLTERYEKLHRLDLEVSCKGARVGV